MATKKEQEVGTLTASELKTFMEALQIIPAYLSKRFVLQELCGWTPEMIERNIKMVTEEHNAKKMNDHINSYSR